METKLEKRLDELERRVLEIYDGCKNPHDLTFLLEQVFDIEDFVQDWITKLTREIRLDSKRRLTNKK